MPSLTLDLFGVLHVDRPGKVRAELDEFAGDADALFIEQPETEVAVPVFGRMAARTPVAFLGALLQLVLIVPLYAVLNREYNEAEAIAVRRLAEENGLPVHEVDDHPALYMSRAGPRWIAANWLAVIGLAWVFGVQFLATAGLLVLAAAVTIGTARFDRRLWLLTAIPATWGSLGVAISKDLLSVSLLVAVFLFYLGSVGIINEHRNSHMLGRIAEISDREKYEQACLVTGKGHLAGLLTLASDAGLSVSRMHVSRWLRTSDDVTEDPDPESLGENSGFDWFTTAFGLTRPDPQHGTEADVFGERMIGAGLDLVFAAISSFAGGVVFGAITGLALGRPTIGVGMVFGFVIVPAGYFFVSEILLGRTPGKWLLGLVVVAEDGSVPSRRAIVVRNLLRPLDFVPFYVPGFVSMLATERTQRIGDVMADTVVVRAE